MREPKTARLSVGICLALERHSTRTGLSQSDIMDRALAEYFSREADGVLKEYAEMRVRAINRELHQELQSEHSFALYHISRIEEGLATLVNERTVKPEEIAAWLRREISGLAGHLHPSRVETSQRELGEYVTMLDKGHNRKLLLLLRERIKARQVNLKEFLAWPNRSSAPRA